MLQLGHILDRCPFKCWMASKAAVTILAARILVAARLVHAAHSCHASSLGLCVLRLHGLLSSHAKFFWPSSFDDVPSCTNQDCYGFWMTFVSLLCESTCLLPLCASSRNVTFQPVMAHLSLTFTQEHMATQEGLLQLVLPFKHGSSMHAS